MRALESQLAWVFCDNRLRRAVRLFARRLVADWCLCGGTVAEIVRREVPCELRRRVRALCAEIVLRVFQGEE